MGNRKICIVTGTRADYGLLSGLMSELAADPEITFQIIATGSHLAEEFGNTYRFIENDGFKIDVKVDMILSGDTPQDIARSTGTGVIGFADAYQNLRPDLIVILGDRFEILAAAQTAMLMKIPLAHIHGGETTEGAIDESIRHAITKMSHIHFTSTQTYRNRVIQMGENSKNVHCVGAPGLDNLMRLDIPDLDELKDSLKFKLIHPLFLVTYHPETLNTVAPAKAVCEMLKALDAFPDATCIITKANADSGGLAINAILKDYAAQNPARVLLVDSLGQARYLGLMKQADVVIGNSSSGIIEAPSTQTPSVNIGDRQKGRIQAGSVIDCRLSRVDIEKAIHIALSKEFLAGAFVAANPYGTPGKIAVKIKDVLKDVDLDNILIKHFSDLPLNCEDSIR